MSQCAEYQVRVPFRTRTRLSGSCCVLYDDHDDHHRNKYIYKAAATVVVAKHLVEIPQSHCGGVSSGLRGTTSTRWVLERAAFRERKHAHMRPFDQRAT
jgi:hypothetical protein